MYDLIEKNLYKLKELYGDDYISYDTIHNHIITNCIYGYDIDAEALNILKQGLKDKDNGKGLSVDKFNIYCGDSLKIKLNNNFDYIIEIHRI